MSTRSATNKRTQSHEVTGVARKSAASAKPARQAASSVRVVPASSKARRKELEKGENLEGFPRRRSAPARPSSVLARIVSIRCRIFFSSRMRTTPSAVVSGGPCSPSAWYSSWQFGLRSTSLPAARCPVLFRWSASFCPMSSSWVTLSTTSFVFVPCATCTARRPRACPRTSSTLLSSVGCRGGQEGLQEEVAFVSIHIAKI